MSITIWCPDAPRVQVPCEFCATARSGGWGVSVGLDGNWADPDDLSPEDLARVTCDPWCQGSHSKSSGPEANLSNHNARTVLGLIGLPPDCGSLHTDEIPGILRKIADVRHTRGRLTPFVETPTDSQGDGGCRVISAGNSEQDILERLTRIEDVLLWAKDTGYQVEWA